MTSIRLVEKKFTSRVLVVGLARTSGKKLQIESGDITLDTTETTSLLSGNYGILLVPASVNDVVSFYPMSDATSSYHPKLTINYSSGTTSTTSSSSNTNQFDGNNAASNAFVYFLLFLAALVAIFLVWYARVTFGGKPKRQSPVKSEVKKAVKRAPKKNK